MPSTLVKLMPSAVFAAAVCVAALLVSASGAQAEQLALLQLIDPEVASSSIPTAKAKCVVIGGFKFCKGNKENDDEDDNHSGNDDAGHKKSNKNKTQTTPPPADTKTSPPAEPKCPKPNMIEVEGGCRCKPGYEFGGGEGCQKKCAYGMIGTPPDCRCPLGAKLEQTGKFTKGCVCEDGRKPEEVEGNYACQNLGPQ